LIDSELYFQTFQNIEKILKISTLIYDSILDAVQLKKDTYHSIINVFKALASIICDTYDVYFRGYIVAVNSLNNSQRLLDILNNNIFNGFNFKEFILLPIIHIFKIYNAFSNLIKMGECKNLKCLNVICNMLKKFIDGLEDQNFSNENLSIKYIPNKDSKYFHAIKFTNVSKKSTLPYSKNYQKKTKSNFPYDYTDDAGNKFYFI
jgi:hypothetical protein